MNRKKIVFLLVSILLMATLVAGGLFGQGVAKDNVYRYLSIFTEVFSLVRSNYVEDVESDKLIAGAFDGLTSAIDEYSYYVPPAEMAEYRDYADPEKTGVGLVMSRRFGYAYVVAPLEGSPASDAGIEAGDFIERIGSVPTQDMALWQIRSALHGEPGSTVELVVLKGTMNRRSTVRIERRDFAIPVPTFKTVEGIGYIRVPFFEPSTPAALEKALRSAGQSGAAKLIIDVRGNADGHIEAAIASADLLLARGEIASVAGRRVEAKTWNADPAVAWEGELLVLADTSSSSAAEVFAAAIQENDRGRIVGTRTYGKAIQQKLVELPSGGALFVTIADYTTPDEKPIRGEGVRPEITVDLTPLAIRGEEEEQREKPDLILEKAISILKSAEEEKKAA